MGRLLLRVVTLLLMLLVTGTGSCPTPGPTGRWLGDSEVAVRRPGEDWETGYDWTPLTDLIDRAVQTLSIEGASLLLVKDGRVVYQHSFGRNTLEEAVPIASASKWLSAATIMTLVDDGRLGLDDPISRYLPSFGGAVGQITIRQLLSHTSGLMPEPPCLGVDGLTLAQCAEQIGQQGLIAKPGSLFHYGGGSFQVAGRIAEVVSGKPWSAVFAEKIKDPLHMDATTYGETQNPLIAGSVVSNLHDYGNFISMLLSRGNFGTVRVLSPASVLEMEANQTDSLPIAVSLHSDGRRYGLGSWLDRVDANGHTLQASSQGDTGFSPWIDLERNLGGVFLTEDGLGSVYTLVAQIQEQVRAIVDARGKR